MAEILRRGWIKGSTDPSVLVRQMCDFMGIATIWDEPEALAALRASGNRGPQESAVLSWLKRVEHLATEQTPPAFDAERLEASLPEVLERSQTAADVRDLPRLLGASGVHFLVVPHLPKSFLDGGSQWVQDRPVVAVTLRYDRIDSLWFTLMHELAHVLFGHRDLLAESADADGRSLVTKGDTPPKPKPRPPVVLPDPGTGPQDDACAEPLEVHVVASSPVEIGTQVLASIRGDQVVAVTANGDLGRIEGEPAVRILDCSGRRWAFPGTVDDAANGLVTITLVPRFRT